MGTIKTTNIEPIANNGTVTLGSSGDTFTVPSGVTVNMSSATQTGVGGANTPAFHAYISSNQNVSDNTITKIEIDTEAFDTASCYDNSSNYRFTPTTAGKYFVYGALEAGSSSNDTIQYAALYLYKNGSVYQSAIFQNDNNNETKVPLTTSLIIDMNGSSDYIELFGQVDVTSGTPRFYESNKSTYFGAYKIIE